MESKGMALRSRRAPQLSEIFRYQAQPQDIEVRTFDQALPFTPARRTNNAVHDYHLWKKRVVA